ncbi:MAG: TrbC/VirB2 family protein [Psittacicella sp.]
MKKHKLFKILKTLKSKLPSPFISAFTFILLGVSTSSSFASSLGGFNTADSYASEIETAIYTLIGTIAIIFLIYKGLMAYFDKIDWMEFLKSVMWVAILGAIPTLGVWAFSIWAS